MSQAIQDERINQLHTPYGFALGVLGMDLAEWQIEALAKMNARGSSLAVKAGNGTGKTSRLAVPLALWHAAVFPNSLTIITAGVFRQVKEQAFPELRRYQHLFPSWKFLDTEVETNTGSRIIGFSTDDAGRWEGWHENSLGIIVDEAKSVPDPIFESISRCQPSRLLLMSSPGARRGQFYRAFTSERRFFQQMSVTAQDCSHIPQSWIDEQIDKYGEHSPLVRSMVFAEFPEDENDQVTISLTDLERCLSNPPEFEDGEVHAFCDYAGGGDENVLAVRRGNKVEIVKAWRDRNTMGACGEFIRLFRQEGLRPSQISGDGSGLGIPILDRLEEEGWKLRRIKNESPAKDKAAYANTGTEIWMQGAERIKAGEIILPNDKLLHEQLVSRRYALNSRGQVQVEPKPKMASRGLQSPDRADALLGAMYQRPRTRILF